MAVICTSPPNPDYAAGCERMGWVRVVPYCEDCGRLPAWCECREAEEAFIAMAKQVASEGVAGHLLNPEAALGGLAAWLPDLSTPEKVRAFGEALEKKLGPLTTEARMGEPPCP